MKKVLIVEDNPIVGMHLEQVVQDMGWVVAGVAEDMQSALATARRVRPHLLLAETMLAETFAGVEAAYTIQKQMKIPVVFVSASDLCLKTVARKGFPCWQHVRKPFRSKELQTTIQKMAESAAEYDFNGDETPVTLLHPASG